MTIQISSTVKCPYPNCGHTGDVITVLHCRTVHGMERAELYGKYGKPERVQFNVGAAKKNLEGHIGLSRLNTAYPSNTDHAKERRAERKREGR